MKYLSEGPAVVIVKHNNPCGVAYGASLSEAYEKANMADRIAAFGGCAVFNRAVDLDTAELIRENYLEVVAAPDDGWVVIGPEDVESSPHDGLAEEGAAPGYPLTGLTAHQE